MGKYLELQALERKIINSTPLQQTGEHCLRTASAEVAVTGQYQTPAVPTKGSLPLGVAWDEG